MEIYESFYTVKVTKHVSGKKLKSSYEKIKDDKHPDVLANPDTPQYGYVTAEAPFSEAQTLFETRLESVDLERIIRASKEKKRNRIYGAGEPSANRGLLGIDRPMH